MNGEQMQSEQSVKYYEVEKILDMKIQNGKKFYLIKWLNWDVETCTWQQESNISYLKAMINQYHESRKFQKQNATFIKILETTQAGMSPYEETKYYGHFLYGDEPQRVVSLQVIQKGNQKSTYLQIEWKPRQNEFRPGNSLIDSKIVQEHCPRFLINFYESKVRLIAQ